MVGPSEETNGTVFLAFHVNCPNRYLSEESINTARQDLGSYPAYILGRIIMVEQHVATEVCAFMCVFVCVLRHGAAGGKGQGGHL